MAKAELTILEQLHEATAQELLKRIKSGQATAADFNAARAFLKDNGVEVTDPRNLKPLGEALTDKLLPFPAQAIG
jgi:hypothetical protein